MKVMSKHFEAFDALRQKGFFIGEFIWNFADFKTAQGRYYFINDDFPSLRQCSKMLSNTKKSTFRPFPKMFLQEKRERPKPIR